MVRGRRDLDHWALWICPIKADRRSSQDSQRRIKNVSSSSNSPCARDDNLADRIERAGHLWSAIDPILVSSFRPSICPPAAPENDSCQTFVGGQITGSFLSSLSVRTKLPAEEFDGGARARRQTSLHFPLILLSQLCVLEVGGPVRTEECLRLSPSLESSNSTGEQKIFHETRAMP